MQITSFSMSSTGCYIYAGNQTWPIVDVGPDGSVASRAASYSPEYVRQFLTKDQENGTEVFLRVGRQSITEDHYLGVTDDGESADAWVNRVNLLYRGRKVQSLDDAIKSVQSDQP
jgi:hypothetical protein